MQPILVMPMSDPSGIMFSYLEATTPLLKTIFKQAVVSVTATTRHNQPDCVTWLERDDFFTVLHLDSDPPVGAAFTQLYSYAVNVCDPDEVLHLAFIDRLAFALQTDHSEQLVTDIQSVTHTPLIFQRSAAAWATHPANYREIEGMVTRVGELLFSQTLDLGWCHMVITAAQLDAALEHVASSEWQMVAELVLGIRDTVQSKDVDWLAWEDPFILEADPEQLKLERENSLQETLKRLTYAIPMIELLYEMAKNQSKVTEET